MIDPVELIVRGVNCFEAERRLQKSGYRLCSEKIHSIDAKGSGARIVGEHEKVYVREQEEGINYRFLLKVRVYIAEPGQLCIRLTGDIELIEDTLVILGINKLDDLHKNLKASAFDTT